MLRDRNVLRQIVKGASIVFHFAAQVAVTTSLADPISDFSINAGGTLNILEALHELDHQIPMIFTSTNKVYGNLENIQLCKHEFRYQPLDKHTRRFGISEFQPLDFASPYGCSKGCADQYVLDYARTFHFPAVVFRMSCIFGPHQFGNEDQGWVAHFLHSALEKVPIHIYGDGHQVRDVLFISDLVDALLLARKKISAIKGEAFNIGGGIVNSISVLETLQRIEKLIDKKVALCFEEWRESDQRYYVSDCTKFREATGWAPKVNITDGFELLNEWLESSTEKMSMAL